MCGENLNLFFTKAERVQQESVPAKIRQNVNFYVLLVTGGLYQHMRERKFFRRAELL